MKFNKQLTKKQARELFDLAHEVSNPDGFIEELTKIGCLEISKKEEAINFCKRIRGILPTGEGSLYLYNNITHIITKIEAIEEKE